MYLEDYVNLTNMTRVPVSKERHELLTKAGFIHVTGLMLIGSNEPEGKPIGRLGDGISEQDRGTYAVTRDQISVLITLDRQVWLGRNDNHNQTVMAHAPNGNNIKVSFEWRLFFHQRDLLCRLADPNWRPDDLPYAPPTAHDIDKMLSDLPTNLGTS